LDVNQEQLLKIEALFQQLDYAPSSDAENRRRSPRLNVRLPLTAMLLSADILSPVSIFTRNISISGMGFVSRRLFKINERLAVKLQVAHLPCRLILARVTFSRYASGGLYEMGAEFIECIRDRQAQRIPNHWLVGGNSSKVVKSSASDKDSDQAH
jgi:hypothetical protein